MLFDLAEMVGARTLKTVRETGRMVNFIIFAIYNVLVNPGKPYHILKQIHFIGAKSTFVIFLTAAFTGMVLGLQEIGRAHV